MYANKSNHMKGVEKLTFIFVDSLDMDIKHCGSVQFHSMCSFYPRRESLFIFLFYLSNISDKRRIRYEIFKFSQLGQIQVPPMINNKILIRKSLFYLYTILFLAYPSPIRSEISAVRLGLHSISHLRGVIPLVLFCHFSHCPSIIDI